MRVTAMSRPVLLVLMAVGLGAAACGAIGSVLGAPSITSVTVSAPAGLLVGESAYAAFNALGDDGQTHNGRPVKWRSSDAAALSIDGQGKMTAHIAGRTATISAEVDGKTGSAVVAVASDDSRFGYALADQPEAAGPYAPAAATSFNSSGGTIEVSHTSTGVYSVRFAGLGRSPGQRDNVQVSAYNTTATTCKPDFWDASLPDLRVTVSCSKPNGVPVDSRFAIMALGAWAFGRTAPIAFVVSFADTGTAVLDSSATARNFSGGHIYVGHVGTGNYSVQFDGIQSTWTSTHAAVMLTAMGLGPRRCHVIATDPASAGFGLNCNAIGGGLGDASFSLLWTVGGRPSSRFGFAWAQNDNQMTDYPTDPAFTINSSGGAVRSRKTGPGRYHVVFAGLGHAAGGKETVLVEGFQDNQQICDIVEWGNTGVSDLYVDVACSDLQSAPTNARFAVLVAE